MDLRTVYDSESRSADLLLAGPQLATDDGLETAVVLSLFTDRRAALDDLLPDSTADRRGWFGDGFADVDGDRIGSHLWLLAREKQTNEVLQRAREYARDALRWLIDDAVARAVDVQASWLRQGVLLLEIDIRRADAAPVRFRFENFWSQSNGV